MHRPVLYTKINSLQRRDADDFSDEFDEQISGMSGRCIDIGCGTCDVTTDFILPKLKPKSTITCTDISETMLNYAKENYGHDERLSFLKLDIESPDLPKDLLERFDHVTSFYCIHWCLDLRQAFRNIYSLLRPGGSAFVTFITNYPSLDAFSVLEAMPKYQTYLKEVRRTIPQFQHVEHPRQNVIGLMTEIGFEIQICSCRAMSNVFETSDHLKGFLLALSPCETEGMSSDLHKDYVNDLMREALKFGIVFNGGRNGEKNFSMLVKYRACVIYCKKPSKN